MHNLSFYLLLQSVPSTSTLQNFLPLVLIAAIFYLLVFMPMQRQKKQQQQMLDSLQSGSEVITTGGIVGTIVNVSDDTVVLRVRPDNIKLQVARSAVATLVSKEEKK